MTQALSPVLVLDRLHARDFDGPKRRARGRLHGIDLSLTAGVHVVLGAPEDGTLALTETVSGARRPLRGRVLVRGREPSRSSAIRARIGALTPMPELPPAATVAELVRIALRARGERDDRFDAILDPYGLSGLHARAPASLSHAEARAVELALALSTPAPVLLVLHEPLAEVAIAHLGVVRERIAELPRMGTCVLVVTSSPADARALADRIYVLSHGVLVRAAEGNGSGLVSAHGGELCAWLRDPEAGSPGVRELAAALADRREIAAVSWDEGQAGAPAATVRVRGADLDACAVALADAAVQAGVIVDAIACTVPALTQVRAASDLAMRSLRK